MPTKTFSSRTDARRLAQAEAIAQKQFGISFGQYCGSVLMDLIEESGSLPSPTMAGQNDRKLVAADFIKSFPVHEHDAEIGSMSDSEISEMIGKRFD